MLPVPENFKRRLLAELSSRIPAQASALPERPVSSIRGRARRPRAGWLAGGLGLIAAASAAAVAIASVTTAPNAAWSGQSAHGRLPAGSQLTGRQILLAAAATALDRPAGSGTFWHVKTRGMSTWIARGFDGAVTEIWTRRDGMQWQSFKPGVITNIGQTRFTVAGVALTFQQLQKLPAQPAALKAWVTAAAVRFDPGLPASQLNLFVLTEGLLYLSYFVPAPPRVRAAAFRAMASFPDVKSLGPVKGGQGLLIYVSPWEQDRVVIDPATSMVRSEIAIGRIGGKTVSKGILVLVAGWADHLP